MKHSFWRQFRAKLKGTPLLFLSLTVHAQNTLAFKEEISHPLQGLSYGLVLIILCVILLFKAKKSTKLMKTNPKARIIETIPIHHKTKAYILDYQGQQFLIADNQNGLAIHPLTEVKPSL